MSAPKPLGRVSLQEEEVVRDRKTAKKYDQCGLGQKALYVGGKVLPRQYYIPYSSITHVYKRIAVSQGSGKAFLTPVLYIVVRYDDGKESENYFKYLNEADKMLQELEKTHPEIRLVSPKSEAEAAEKERREEQLRERRLSEEAAHAVRKLENAEEVLHRRPGLYQDLAGRARRKRTADLMKPGFQALAIAIFAAGIVLIILSIAGLRFGLNRMTAIMMMLIGAAAVFTMVNSRILPTPSRSRKSTGRKYAQALDAMQHHINSYPGFPLPARYAHPVVLDRMIRIIREDRAETVDGALEVLKDDLRKADSSVQLPQKDYNEVVTIKPLFTVCDYK